nr:ribosome maturation factor RimM [uncultured Agathobaculum sp.]
MPKQFLEAGKIVGTHGIRGDLKVQSWCDSPEVLCDFDTLYLDENTPVAVQRAQVHKNIVLMHLKGVDSPEAAEALRGRVLHIDRDDVELPEDLVFIQDILGFTVFDRRLGREIGRLHDVLTDNPAHDMYEVATPAGRLVYIPASKPFLQQIDMKAGIIYIESIEGLVE